MPNERNSWHRKVIAGATDETLQHLLRVKLLDGFYLAGGTGLALQFGHRLSHDLDFFASTLFDEDALLQRLQGQPNLSLAAKAPHTLHLTIGGTKVSFLGYAYPLLFPLSQFSGVAVAEPRDIACMKISALASRGAKRDFVDLFFASQHFGLEELLRLFALKYRGYSKIHVLKSLTFFDDAEKDPMPQMLVPLEWERVKQFFQGEAPGLF